MATSHLPSAKLCLRHKRYIGSQFAVVWSFGKHRRHGVAKFNIIVHPLASVRPVVLQAVGNNHYYGLSFAEESVDDNIERLFFVLGSPGNARLGANPLT